MAFTHGAGRRSGHSAIVDPWGRVLAERPQGEAVLLAVRDAAEQADIRRRMPVVAHRRFFLPAESAAGAYGVNMSELLSSVSQQLLAPGGLELDSLPGILHELNGPASMPPTCISRVRSPSRGCSRTASSRKAASISTRVSGYARNRARKTGFAYSNAITAEALKQAAVAARSISRAGQNGSVQAFKAVVPARLYAGENPLDVLSRAEKVELLKQIDAATRALDPRIQQVTVSMAGVWEQILVAASDGPLAADIRPLVRFQRQRDRRTERPTRTRRPRRRRSHRLSLFLQEDRAMGYACEALRQALVNLEAIPAPAGTLPVVMGAGWSGVLLHEAVGHGLEGDFNRRAAPPTAAGSAKRSPRACAPSSTTAPWPGVAAR